MDAEPSITTTRCFGAGIVTGIVGGLVVGKLSGCTLQVSGPAAGLAVLVYEIVKDKGVETLAVILLMAGAVQILAGALKLGQWFRAVSPAVINGMLSGIGILILASQFHIMLDDKPHGSGLQNLLSIPYSIWECIQAVELTQTHIAGAVGLLTLIVLMLWTKMPPKFKLVPAALLGVVIATAVTEFLHLDISRVNLPDQLSDMIRLPQLAKIEWQPVLLFNAVALAFIASAETLLSATAVDRMHTGPRTRYDRELMAQGTGNIICGFLGSLPMTGVIVRSSTNVLAGAQTRLSAILHGFWLLLMVLIFPSVIELVPTASLAALLVYTGFKLVDLKSAKGLLQFGKSELAIYLATIAMIVAEDLLTGVLTGIALSLIKLIYIFAWLDVRMDNTDGIYILWLKGSATFISLPKLASALERVPNNAELHVHLENLDYIDHACLDLLMNWEAQQKDTGGSLVIDWGSLGARFRQGVMDKQKERYETSAAS
jgi:MFS superfamily sulfate permease-like transporter